MAARTTASNYIMSADKERYHVYQDMVAQQGNLVSVKDLKGYGRW